VNDLEPELAQTIKVKAAKVALSRIDPESIVEQAARLFAFARD
jgi:hypothetical protein